jgi:mRNA-degrading endonuclease YafQ of YafQ-DinJ toxin-antitoxin module
MIKNPLRIEFSERFNKQRKEAPLEVKVAFLEALELFQENPNNPQLRNHSLKEKYSGYNSIDVTDDWRALFKFHEKQNPNHNHISYSWNTYPIIRITYKLEFEKLKKHTFGWCG